MTAYNPGDKYCIKSNTNPIHSNGKTVEFAVVKDKVGIFRNLDNGLQDFDGLVVTADLHDIERV